MKQTAALVTILVLLVHLTGCAENHPTQPSSKEDLHTLRTSRLLDEEEFRRAGHRFLWVSHDTCFQELSYVETMLLEEEALQHEDVQEAIALLASDGFILEMQTGFGWKAMTDRPVGESNRGDTVAVAEVVMTQLFLSLSHPDSTIREAEVIYCTGRGGQYLGVSAGVFRHTDDQDNPIAVDEVYSSDDNRAFSFWDCWFGPTLEVCAGAAIGCAVSGPAYAKCVVAICGGHAVGRAIRCGFKKWGWCD